MLASLKFSGASFIPFLKIETMSVILCPLKFLLHFMNSRRYTFQIACVGFLWPKFTSTHSLLAIAPYFPRLPIVFLTTASDAMLPPCLLQAREASLAFLHLELLLSHSPGAPSASPTCARLCSFVESSRCTAPRCLSGVITGSLREGVQ